MHLVDDIVVGIGQTHHGSAGSGGHPGPGTRVRISLDKDGLRRRASGTNAVDGCLVQLIDQGVVHVVIFVVGVEDDV